MERLRGLGPSGDLPLPSREDVLLRITTEGKSERRDGARRRMAIEGSLVPVLVADVEENTSELGSKSAGKVSATVFSAAD